jgi:hypothetical protein
VAQCKRLPLGLIGAGLCCENELKLKNKKAVNARKVNFFKAVLFWVKNKVLVAQIIATSLQNYSRKRKICFSR